MIVDSMTEQLLPTSTEQTATTQKFTSTIQPHALPAPAAAMAEARTCGAMCFTSRKSNWKSNSGDLPGLKLIENLSVRLLTSANCLSSNISSRNEAINEHRSATSKK